MGCVSFHVRAELSLFERVALVQAEENIVLSLGRSCWFSETAYNKVWFPVSQLFLSLLGCQRSLLAWKELSLLFQLISLSQEGMGCPWKHVKAKSYDRICQAPTQVLPLVLNVCHFPQDRERGARKEKVTFGCFGVGIMECVTLGLWTVSQLSLGWSCLGKGNAWSGTIWSLSALLLCQ